VDETNPRLTKLLAALAQFEKGDGTNAIEPASSEARVQSKKLWEVGAHHPALNSLLPRLNEWSVLNRAARDHLLRRIDVLHEESTQRDERRMFLQAMARAFKADVDAFLSLLTLLLVTAGGITGSLVLMSDITWRCVGILTSVVAGFVCLVLVQRWRRRRAHRKFFHTILLPQASSQGVDLARFVVELRDYPPGESELDKKIQAMARALPVLKEGLGQMEVPLEPAPSDKLADEIGENPEDPVLFLLAIGKDFKPKNGDPLPFLAGLSAAVLIFAAAVIWLEKVATLPKLLLVLFGGGVSTFWMHRWLERRRHRRFFRKILVPEALRRGVELSDVVEVLVTIRAKHSEVEHPLHSLARSWQLLDSMIGRGSDESLVHASAKR